MTTKAFGAVDLGASSGRVMLGEVGPDRLDLTEVHRFPNLPVRTPIEGGTALYWDVLRLWNEIQEGLRKLPADVVSLGVDSWAVDYGLLDDDGQLLANVRHYRDDRNEPAAEAVHAKLAFDQVNAINGLQHLPFTTLYQLAAEAPDPVRRAASKLLLVPDLLMHWLGAPHGTELTNASTTGLLDVRTGEWSADLMELAGVSPTLLAPLRRPGDVVGTLSAALAADTGLPTTTALTAVGSHDTASAVVGVPAEGKRFAYVACGTWALVGVELDAPVVSDEAREAGFTNEGGVDGTTRFLHNVMGLWLLQESMRVWLREDPSLTLPSLLAEAAQLPSGAVIDVDAPVFLPPGDMPGRIAAAVRALGLPEPRTRAETVRVIVDSLASAFARVVADAVKISGQEVDVVHVVGGGSLNQLLCELTAEATGLPVLAGPVEATALGNVLVQARAHGVIEGGLDEMRALIRRTHEVRRYEPRGVGGRGETE